MGNIFSSNKHNHIKTTYEPFINNNIPYSENVNKTNLEEQMQQLTTKNQLLEKEIISIKIQLDLLVSKIDKSIQIKYNELTNTIIYHNENNNAKISIITRDMENLLNNDKILLEKLIEKNIVSIIQED